MGSVADDRSTALATMLDANSTIRRDTVEDFVELSVAL
jgi:hypothetical protein